MTSGPDPRLLNKTLKVLEAARRLVASRSQWTKRVFARDKYGHEVPIESLRAVRFCAAGALIRADLDLAGKAIGPDDDVYLSSAGFHALIRLTEAFAEELEQATEYAAAIRFAGMSPLAAELSLELDPDIGVRLVNVLAIDNDLPEIRHRHVLAAFDKALEQTAELRKAQSKRRRKHGAKSHPGKGINKEAGQ